MATINGTAGNDTLVGTASTDTISGLGGNDLLQAADGNDSVLGGAGNDTVRGNNGTDWVEGGAGNDNVGGGSGQDSFVFREAGSANADVTNDYLSNWDNIQLDAAFFTALGSAGRFSASDARFWSSGTGTAHDANDRIIYNTSTRQLWYDADGNGSGAALLIATLNTGATVIAGDIRVFGAPAGGSGQTINGTSGNDSLVGGSGNDTINGFDGNDTIDGGAGNDSLIGGAGADSLIGGAGNDTLEGGGFDDTIDGGAGVDTQIMESGIAGAGIERIILRGYSEVAGSDGHGNELDNTIIDEGPGNSFLYGNGGNDTLIGGGGFNVFVFEGNPSGSSDAYGHDSVDGGGGIDWLFFEGNSSAVTVDFRAGTVIGGSPVPASVTFVNVERAQGTTLNDVMFASDAGNWLNGYGGNDTLTGGAGADQISGDDGFGHPTVSPGNDSISGGGGNDGINGEEGNDWVDGGSGNDQLRGGEGTDSFAFTVAPGAANADQVSDFVSADDQIVLDGNVHASSGPSGTFAAGDARFWFSGTGTAHDGDDRVIYNTSTGQLWYDADGNAGGTAQLIATLEGAPSLAAADITIVNGSGGGGGGGGSTINGTSGNDTLSGTAGNDTINGLGGNDLILGGSAGADVINGGAGSDSIEYKAAATSAMVVDFVAGTITGGAPGSVSFTSIERVVAGNFNDQMTGNAAAQNLAGQGGADTLWGAAGADTLWGGGGADAFIFREMGSTNADRISDFASGSDKVQLDDVAFTSIGALGNFAASDGRFWSAPGATAHDANDRVIYNQSTGSLYYDADGNGSEAAQLIATFSGNPAVAAADIVVI